MSKQNEYVNELEQKKPKERQGLFYNLCLAFRIAGQIFIAFWIALAAYAIFLNFVS